MIDIDSQTQELLFFLGLSEVEIKLYIAALKLEKSNVQQLAEIADLKRASLYPHLNSLKEKKFIKQQKKLKKSYITAIEPEKILDMYRKKQKEIAETKKELSNAISEIKKLQPKKKTIDKPVIWFHEKEGIKKIYEISLNTKDTILAWSPAESITQSMKEYNTEYVNKRVSKKIKIRSILRDTKIGLSFKEKHNEQLRTAMYLPHKKYRFTNQIKIFDNKVAIMNMKSNKIGIIIENQEFADTMRAIHSICWDYAKRIKKK